MRFDELDLGDDVLDALDAMRFEECTPIQEQAIPVILEGRDLIACAQTGTGKTAAYLLPVIDRIAYSDAPADTIKCIVMSPTRELAMQIDRQMEGFGYFLPVSSLPVYGGTDGATYALQQKGLKAGADIVIATPGRLLDHIRMRSIDFSHVETFILDEADRMLDMGFYDDIMQIVRRLPSERQTLMFSATMPPKTRRLAKEILTDPYEISLAVSKPAESIDQSAVVCYEPQKEAILHRLFEEHSKRVIVFAASKVKVKNLTRELRRRGVKAAEMHSDLEQARRNEVMDNFRAGRVDIVIATDILARGIDIDDISMVVNYDVPREAEDYVHRIGRTARAGAGGMAVTLVSPDDQPRFGRIERFLGYEVRKQAVPADLGDVPEYKPDGRHGGSGGGRGRGKGRGKSRPKRNKPQAVKAEAPKQQAPKPETPNGGERKPRGGRNRHRRRSRKTNTPKSE